VAETHTVYCSSCGADLPSTFMKCPTCGGRELLDTPKSQAKPRVDTADLGSSNSQIEGVLNQSQSSSISSSEEMKYAGFWVRAGAYIIDSLILMAGGFAYGYVIGTLNIFTKAGYSALYFKVYIGWILICWLYFALLESSPWQATLGKRALHLKVFDTDGQKISFGRASLRYLGKLISGFLLALGFLLAAFTDKKQALHDFMANTVVIRT
jgi:uncharacterized RDD family membrane protein YckC